MLAALGFSTTKYNKRDAIKREIQEALESGFDASNEFSAHNMQVIQNAKAFLNDSQNIQDEFNQYNR